MIKIEKIAVNGWEAAVRGMRNAMNSWDKSDSDFDLSYLSIGDNDLALMKKLANAGSTHAKYRRMINVSCDITTNHVWWAEFDTYKVGTVRNSCSKMHKIHVKEFTSEDFSKEGIEACGAPTVSVFLHVVGELERLRKEFNATNEKKYWRAIIELLPMGFNLKATVQLNYEVLANIYASRKNHKLDEWREFCKWIEGLPYSEIITGGNENVQKEEA